MGGGLAFKFEIFRTIFVQLYRFVNTQPCLLLSENPEGWDVVRNAFQLLVFIKCHLIFWTEKLNENHALQLQIERSHLRDSAGYHSEMHRAQPRQGSMIFFKKIFKYFNDDFKKI